MKRVFVLSFLGAAGALGMWYGLRGTAPLQTSAGAVTGLLPKETLAFVHLPDFKQSRGQWHETDLYKLWREPAVQDFLQKPLARAPKTDTARQKLQEMDALEMMDAFFAITAFENHEPKVLGGFRFKGSVADAEKVIGPWRARLQENVPAEKRETVTHEGHQIEVASKGAITIATVYDDNWFFAGNDLASLKTLLDRADKRVHDPATTLTADENFAAAAKHMPRNYAAFGYARLDTYMQKLAARLSPEAEGNEQTSGLRQIRSIAAATTFAKGKIRDVLFVAMPKMEESGELTRSSLTLATKESFLYLANLLNFPRQIPLPNPQATGASGMPAAFQSFLIAFAANGITRDDWDSAFVQELGVIGDWPATTRLPALFATVGVKDATRARKIVETLTSPAAGGTTWTASEKDGVQYFSQVASNPMLPVAPAIALSNRLLVAGLDSVSVEAAIKRSASAASDLAATENFKTAEGMVPPPKQSFAYIDTALLYNRLDAALRPMLVMAAAFVPGIAETVDLGKLPAADIITKHLSPLAISQSYQGDGYMTESVGPISVFQAALGTVGVTGAGANFYQRRMQGSADAFPEESPKPSVEPPSPTPDETP